MLKKNSPNARFQRSIFMQQISQSLRKMYEDVRVSLICWSVVLMVRLDPRFCVWAMLFSANRASSLRSLKVKLVALVIYRAYGSSRTVLGSPNDFRESVLSNGSFQRTGSINRFFCSLRHYVFPTISARHYVTTNFKCLLYALLHLMKPWSSSEKRKFI